MIPIYACGFISPEPWQKPSCSPLNPTSSSPCDAGLLCTVQTLARADGNLGPCMTMTGNITLHNRLTLRWKHHRRRQDSRRSVAPISRAAGECAAENSPPAGYTNYPAAQWDYNADLSPAEEDDVVDRFEPPRRSWKWARTGEGKLYLVTSRA